MVVVNKMRIAGKADQTPVIFLTGQISLALSPQSCGRKFGRLGIHQP